MTDQPKNIVLRDNHRIFADRYLITGRARQSAIDAGYDPNSAHVTANRLLKSPKILAYLKLQAERARTKEAKRQGSTTDLQQRVVQELETMAFANIADFIRIDADGRPQVDFSTATEEQLRAITSIASKSRVTTQRNGDMIQEEESKFVMADKYRGLELLARHLGMLKPEEHKVTIDVADRLLAARNRVNMIEASED